MKTVCLIRHAKSSWSNPSLQDIDRPLNNRGLRDAPFMAKLLKGKGISPDLIVSSPANRAFTTASYFAEAAAIPREQIRIEREVYEAWPADILRVIQQLPESANTILLFGHNPGFTSLANQFANEYIPNVPTCGIVHISGQIDTWAAFNPDSARQIAFYYPKQYFT
ncbi:MAG: histidine phosphatase family protein [Bacteroidota bacterium]